MVDPDRRPTAQEIEELIDLVRRDPASPAFIDLGEAYLALGRPRDALQVGNLGLEQSPDNLEARVMMARAYASLHQWKEAQGELLRVVKVDRSSRAGFALLGEVLLRRSDYERAVPVLQHAQNLDPTSPQILSMLKRARSGQPLEPPPPVPTPVAPRGATDVPMQIQRSGERPMPPRPAPPPPSASMSMRSQPMAHAPTVPAGALLNESPTRDLHGHHDAPPPPLFGNGAAAPAPSRPPKPSAPPPPMSVEGVRPRVISTAKPQNAAAASLRQSAAVGESYLNDLLTGGLLDVAGVRVPDSEFDLRPDRRWGRSTRRAFVFLFVVLVLGIGGGGTWYWWTEKQRAEAVARLQKESKQSIGAGDYAGLQQSLTKLSEAAKLDGGNVLTLAYFVEAQGLESLLYGTEPKGVDDSIMRIGKSIQPGDPGSREIVIGHAAADLARVYGNSGASPLAETLKRLDGYLKTNESDKWGTWLKARVLLAQGDRKAGRALLKSAADGEDGVIVAMIDQADVAVDDGQLDDAVALYDKVIKKSKDHPLAVIGKSLARAEAQVDVDKAIDDLSVTVQENKFGPRVDAYRALALSLAQTNQEEYEKANTLLKAATAKPPGEPRFWARVAWAHIVRGELEVAAKITHDKIRYFPTGKGQEEEDPPTKLVRIANLLASGLPQKALDGASKLDGVRSRILRAYALLDLGKPSEALTEMDEVLKRAPDNIEAKILREEARMVSSTGKERTSAADALESLSRKVQSKIGRHALGMGYFYIKDYKNAQTNLETALNEISEKSPNPVQYRTRTALAQILFDAGKLDDAAKQLDAALDEKVNSGYDPARMLRGRIHLKQNEPDKALVLMKAPYDDGAITAPEDKLAFAEALIRQTKSGTAKEKEQAKEVARKYLEEVKDKITPVTEVSRVAALLDPKLPKEMGLPEPPPEGGTTAPKKCPGGHRRC
jgi:tetratricopeptide (TPR) repeat protein